jgi:hypothetical protein
VEDVLWRVVGGLAGVGACAFAGLQASRLPRVWRGGAVPSLPWTNMLGPQVNHRSYPLWTAFAVSVIGGMGLLLGGAAADLRIVGQVGVVLMLAGAVFVVPLWIAVNAVNRPAGLVPPSRRDQPGWWHERHQRSDRRRAGRPATTHVVEILDVRAPASDPRPYDPYFVAVCTDDDCNWMSDPVARDAAHPEPEATVRSEAATHSANFTGPRRPLG